MNKINKVIGRLREEYYSKEDIALILSLNGFNEKEISQALK